MEGTLNEPKAGWTTGDNFLQNATEIREFEFVVNGRDTSIDRLELEGLQCITGVCPQATVVIVPIAGDALYWSNTTTWDSGVLPVAGEDVHIKPGVHIILDIETPILNLVTVNGRLSFYDNTETIHLKAK